MQRPPVGDLDQGGNAIKKLDEIINATGGGMNGFPFGQR